MFNRIAGILFFIAMPVAAASAGTVQSAPPASRYDGQRSSGTVGTAPAAAQVVVQAGAMQRRAHAVMGVSVTVLAPRPEGAARASSDGAASPP